MPARTGQRVAHSEAAQRSCEDRLAARPDFRAETTTETFRFAHQTPWRPLPAAGTPARAARSGRRGPRARTEPEAGRGPVGRPGARCSPARAPSPAAALSQPRPAGMAEEKEARALTPTRNPPARRFGGVHGRDRAAARLLPHPGRSHRGRALPGPPQPPRPTRPSPAGAAGSLLPPSGRSGDFSAALRWTGLEEPRKATRSRKTGSSIPRAGVEAWLVDEIITATFIELLVSVPKFDKIPWFSEASRINKPLVLSLPKRSPHASATFLISSKKDMNLPILFPVPDDLSKARRNQSDPMLIRNKQLCSTCREMKMVQPRTMMIPGDLKLSFKNFMNHRMMSLQPPKAQTVPKCSCDDIPTESIHYRLPILGPRTAVFSGLLSDTYKTLQGTRVSSYPRKEPARKTVRQ